MAYIDDILEEPEKLINSDIAVGVIEELEDEDKYVVELSSSTGYSKEAVSKILRVLVHFNLIKRTNRTKRQYYGVTDKGLQFLDERKNALEEISDVKQEFRSFLEEDK